MLMVKRGSPFLGNLKSLAEAVETATLNTSDTAKRRDGSFMVKIAAFFMARPVVVNRKTAAQISRTSSGFNDDRAFLTTLTTKKK
jgi:hypothetical protein